jgi:predicted dienelactone hydrolase
MVVSPDQTLELYDDSRPNWSDPGPRPVRVHVWRPTRADGRPPTVLVSHGSGGAAVQMSWLSEPLAAAGFLVVAFDHHGNNFLDGYLAEGFARWWERALDVTFALDRLAEREEIGPAGAAGFSLGGYTAAALLGARLDPALVGALFAGARPVQSPPEYPELEQELRAKLTAADIAEWVAASGRDYSDDRLRAAFLVCPALGPLLDKGSLSEIEGPVMVRWVDRDDIAVPAENAQLYADLIPGADGRSADGEAGHYVFLADNPEFPEVRELVAADAVRFFREQLRG